MPLTNEDIAEFKQLLTEIRDRLSILAPVQKAVVTKPQKKTGRPKGSKNVKRVSKRKHRTDKSV